MLHEWTQVNSHFKENISGQHIHFDSDTEHRVVLSMSRVVALEETSRSAKASAGELCEVEVREAQLLEGPASLQFLKNEKKKHRT